MSLRFALLAAEAATIIAAGPASAAFTIDFADYSGDANPLTIPTTDGNTATFDSPAGASTFTVENTNGLFTGFTTGLGDYLSFAGDTLTIAFANPIQGGVTLPFGIEDAFGGVGADFLTVTSNSGVTVVANTTLDNLAFPEPEGSAYINAPGATELTITSANPYAIGSVDVPEPVTLSTFGVALAGLAAARRRT